MVLPSTGTWEQLVTYDASYRPRIFESTLECRAGDQLPERRQSMARKYYWKECCGCSCGRWSELQSHRSERKLRTFSICAC